MSINSWHEFLNSEEVKNQLGNKGDYYLNIWKKIIEREKIKSCENFKINRFPNFSDWNWSAFLFTFFWGAWRQVKYSWIICLIWGFANILLSYFFAFNGVYSWIQTCIISVSVMSIYGFYGNVWFLESALNRISKNKPIKKSWLMLILIWLLNFLIAAIGLVFVEPPVVPKKYQLGESVLGYCVNIENVNPSLADISNAFEVTVSNSCPRGEPASKSVVIINDSLNSALVSTKIIGSNHKFRLSFIKNNNSDDRVVCLISGDFTKNDLEIFYYKFTNDDIAWIKNHQTLMCN